MNKIIREALESATRRKDQPEDVARQLVSWFKAVADGSDGLDDRERTARRTSDLFDSVRVENFGEDEGNE